MKILSVDTSSVSGSIALLEGQRLLAETTSAEAGPHAKWLLPSVKSLLDSSRLTPADIGLYAVTTGPGSFTGLRIGISVVKGLAWSAGKKAVGVSTLAAIAMNFPYSGRPVCIVLDARKGELYAAVYDTSGGVPEAVLEDSVLSQDALLGAISRKGLGGLVFAGSGLSACHGLVERVPGAVSAPEPLWHVRAANVGLIASGAAQSAVSPAGLLPVYLRRSEAEIKFG